MGHIYASQLSPANEARQDATLAREARHGLPLDHFWTVVHDAYYLADIREAGNDRRFAARHPWVDREFHRRDREALTAPIPGLPVTLPIDVAPSPVATTGVPASPGTFGSAGVPEPSGLAMIAIGAMSIGAWLWGGRKP